MATAPDGKKLMIGIEEEFEGETLWFPIEDTDLFVSYIKDNIDLETPRTIVLKAMTSEELAEIADRD